MQRDLKVLLVEDEKELCEEFRRRMENTEGLKLIASTDSASQALELVRGMRPDVVILDLELHMGEGNGITFLSKLGKQKGVKLPCVIVNTNNSSQITRSIVRDLGADFVMSKHQQGNNVEEVVELLVTIAPEQIAAADGNPGVQPQQDSEERPDRSELRERIFDELNKVAISPKRKGYIYLADAIEICCGGYVPNISVMLGEKHGKSAKSVEHAMQNAIDRAWDDTDLDEQATYYKARYSANRLSPTVKEFISYYAAKIGKDC